MPKNKNPAKTKEFACGVIYACGLIIDAGAEEYDYEKLSVYWED